MHASPLLYLSVHIILLKQKYFSTPTAFALFKTGTGGEGGGGGGGDYTCQGNVVYSSVFVICLVFSSALSGFPLNQNYKYFQLYPSESKLEGPSILALMEHFQWKRILFITQKEEMFLNVRRRRERKEGGREWKGGREGGREGGMEGRRDGRREGGREGGHSSAGLREVRGR